MFSRIQHRLSRTLRTLLTGNAQATQQRIIPRLSAAEVQEAREFFPLEKFFIFGHARSGTTLLARLIRVHPDVHCNWQAHFFTRPPMLAGLTQDERVATWLARKSNRWNRGRDLTPVALRAVADFILERDARRVGARVVGDKSPNVLTNGEAVRHMHALYPDAKLIYIVRDGRDTLLSHRFQNFIDGPQFLAPADLRIRDDFARDPAPYFAGQKSLFTPQAFERMAAGWVRNVLETDRLAKDLYGDQYGSLRYEDLLQEPFDEISRLWALLGVDPRGHQDAVFTEMSSNPDADWQQEKAGHLVAQLERGKRGSWRSLFTTQDKQRFNTVAGKLLVEWNYDLEMDG